MSRFSYLGNNVGVINAFYPLDNDEGVNLTVKSIKENDARHLIAITADLYQKNCHKLLAQNGFKRIARFTSAHNNAAELVTLWVKEANDASPNEAKHTIDPFPPNCSVCYKKNITHLPYHPHCFLEITEPTDKDFEKIPNSPIWFKVVKKYARKIK